MLKNTTSHYGSISKGFHWLISLLVLGMLIAGFTMANMESSPLRSSISDTHKSLGILILALMVLRLLWRWMNTTPVLPLSTPMWEKFASKFGHYAFYFLLIAMPLTGWIMGSAAGRPPEFFGLFTMPNLVMENRELGSFMRQLHGIFAYSLVVLIVLHFLAAMKHHFVSKNDVLKRMI